MLKRLVLPAKAMAACLALVSAVACSGTASLDSPNAPSLSSGSARSDQPVDPPVDPPKDPPVDPPKEGGQGCTPGYWKAPQHADSWPAPYGTTTLFITAFGVDAFPDQTLDQVLATGGGGLNALGRHAVAALLNGASAGVSYDMTAADVVVAFTTAYGSGSFEATKNRLAAFNEQGCPLN